MPACPSTYGEFVASVSRVYGHQDRADPRGSVLEIVHSGQLGAQIPTRSPFWMPLAIKPPATTSVSVSNSAYVQRLPDDTSTRASLSGYRTAVLRGLRRWYLQAEGIRGAAVSCLHAWSNS